MADLIIKDDEKELDLLSIFKWFNAAGFFSYQKEREQLPVDKFTIISKDTIQKITVLGKSIRLNIDDEVLLSILIEKTKNARSPEIVLTLFNLSMAAFNRTDSGSYQAIKESLNALKTSIVQLQKNDISFIFSFIDSLTFDDNMNEKGKVKIRLSKEIYDFFTKENKYLIAFDIKNYRRLTGGRIQKLLYFYFLSVNLTMPTPLIKIKEILKLDQKLKDFKKSFTDNLINVLAAEGVYIKIKGDDLIYHRTHRRIATKNEVPTGLDPEPKYADMDKFNFDQLRLHKSFAQALCKNYAADNVVKALDKMQYIKKTQDIKNPAGFLKAMLADGTYEDAADIKNSRERQSNELIRRRKDKEIEDTLDELAEEIYENMDPAERAKRISGIMEEYSGPDELKEGLAILKIKAQIRDSVAVNGGRGRR